MDGIVDAEPDTKKPDFYYAEESQQNCFTCSRCQNRIDILGRFSYCCSCGVRNNLAMFQGDVVQVKKSADDPSDRVRKVVSNFESCGRDCVASMVKRIPMTKKRCQRAEHLRFHSASRTNETIRKVFDIDMLSGLSGDDITFADKMFARRHIFEHRAGVADEKYIRESRDTEVKEGQVVRETPANVGRLCDLLLQMAENLHLGFHSILAPLKK